MFPGQGSQYVGMGKDVYDNYLYAKKAFQQVDEALDEDFSNKIFNGDEDELRKSYNTQPALMAVSVAVFLAMKEEYGNKLDELNIKGVAGHSLGEYSAICVAGGLTIMETAKILRKRGEAMSNCVSDDTGMLAVIGSNNEVIQENIDAIKPRCLVIANSNSPAQTVVSGYKEDIDKFTAQMQGKAKRLIPLAVSGAFHSPLMQKAQDEMQQPIDQLGIKEVKYPVLQNYSSNFETDATTIKTNLQKQITSPVLWCECMRKAIADGFDTFIEIGAKNVLTGLMKRIVTADSNVKIINVEKVEDIKTLMEKIK